MAGWAARKLTDIPIVTDGEPDDPVWHPLQHFFGLSAFGANVFVAHEANQTLIEEHDERSSGQEELYLVLEGEATFELDGEKIAATSGTAVAVTAPTVTRRAVAREIGTTLLAIGAAPGSFTSTWLASHFEDVPRA
ncbi:MAG TPA: hypothetical protein VI540_06935 [Gaiellaceae bacterium]|nr:hypothetical protein [Gaiellaceae bacterium]HLE99618.1 hypothetical protein [Gaiellaceae bacterium]